MVVLNTGVPATRARTTGERETTIAADLRAIERAYRAALEPVPAPEFSRILPTTGRTPDHERELE